MIESKYCVVRMRSFLGSLCIPYGFTLSESILDLSATYAFSFKSDLLISVIDFVVFFLNLILSKYHLVHSRIA